MTHVHIYIYIHTETSYTYTIEHNIRLSICIYTWYIQNILIVYISSPHPIHGDSSNATQDGKLLGQKYGVTTGLIQAIANSRGQRNAWGYLAETGQQWWVNSPAALLAFRKDTCLFVGHVSFYCFFISFAGILDIFGHVEGKVDPDWLRISPSPSRVQIQKPGRSSLNASTSVLPQNWQKYWQLVISMAMVKLAEISPPSSRAGRSRKATLFINGTGCTDCSKNMAPLLPASWMLTIPLVQFAQSQGVTSPRRRLVVIPIMSKMSQ